MVKIRACLTAGRYRSAHKKSDTPLPFSCILVSANSMHGAIASHYNLKPYPSVEGQGDCLPLKRGRWYLLTTKSKLEITTVRKWHSNRSVEVITTRA